MTNEEAIKRLKSDIYEYSDFTENPNENEFWTAFDMAIEALKERTRTHGCDSSEHETHEEHTDDCISREAAIQAVTHFEDTLKRLYELPAVNPARWIPCKERMPKDYEEVLVYSRIDDGIYVMYHIARDEWWESNDGEGFCFDDYYIAAWQPLPEPYKEKKNEKNLEIPMEEECIDCSRLKLNTDVIYADGYSNIKSHGCKHREFCRDIVHHLKEHGWRKVREDNNEKN